MKTLLLNSGPLFWLLVILAAISLFAAALTIWNAIKAFSRVTPEERREAAELMASIRMSPNVTP